MLTGIWNQYIRKGIPSGWKGIEETSLRFKSWRFYYLNTADKELSVREKNWVTCGHKPRNGTKGLVTFLNEVINDNTVLVTTKLAQQVGYFLLKGNSRQGCRFQVIENKKSIQCEKTQESVRFEGWYDIGRCKQKIAFEYHKGGKFTLDTSEMQHD